MKIAIVGFSRFGQLWAKLMKPFGPIMIFNQSDKKEMAQDLGAEFFNFDQLEKINQADLIFLAVSISATEEVIRKIAPFAAPEAVVMDVCSVKVLPCQWLADNIPAPVQVMGTHPMFGPDSAKAGLAGKQIILCPLRIEPEKLAKIKHIFEQLQLTIIETTPEEHDRQAAYSLGLVHFLGRGLEKLRLDGISITTFGFQCLMQVKENVSNDSWQLYLDMQNYNPYAPAARQQLLQALNSVDESTRQEGE